jgi:hypothetical protein
MSRSFVGVCSVTRSGSFGHRPIGRWVGPAILIIQNLLGVAIINSTDGEDRERVASVWSRHPSIVVVFTTVFLAGQAARWLVYALKKREATSGLHRGRITGAKAMLAVVMLSPLAATIAIPAAWL